VGTRFWIVALAALTLAWGAVLVDPGPNQNAHLARVTALAHGTTRIDPYHNWSADIAYYKGHYYAAKAPGLALLTVPWYFVLEATGLLVHGPPPNVPWPLAESFKSMSYVAPWELALWGSLLPFLGLLLLVRNVTERLVPGLRNRHRGHPRGGQPRRDLLDDLLRPRALGIPRVRGVRVALPRAECRAEPQAVACRGPDRPGLRRPSSFRWP